MIFLLDVNVLIALIDPAHVSHEPAHAWFGREGASAWATCPMVENGVMRIVGHPKYPNTPGTPAAVASVLGRFRAHAGHHFWPDTVSLVNEPVCDPGRLLSSGQITDTYLLALAVTHGGRLATLDRRLDSSAIRGGKAALQVI